MQPLYQREQISCDCLSDPFVVDNVDKLRYYITYRYISDLLAQLGEHYLDRVGVSGSSPLQIITEKLLCIKGFSYF